VAFLALEAEEPLAYGLLSLAAALRQHGHEVSLVSGRQIDVLAERPEVQAADVLAMSATTGLHRIFAAWARALRPRHPDKLMVLGGPHPTFFPQVIDDAPFDGICIGEGEESFPELLDSARAGRLQPVPGWWVRSERGGRGSVLRGPDRAPVMNLDALPPPAFDLFYDPAQGGSTRFAAAPNKIFLATRGCPFRCTYCFNRTLNERHRPWGHLLRAHDPERVADDIQTVREQWGLKLAWFLDANFVADVRWLEAFVPVYRRRIGLPFTCKLRPERATERIVKLLADAGCTGAGVGIESGSESLRRTVLGRAGSNADIMEGCARLRRHGIRILAFNMLGIPGETLEDALRTVAFNVACGVDFAAATILQPYPDTELARRAQAEGIFDGDFDSLEYSYFAPSPFRFSSPEHGQRIANLQRLFSLAVEFPEVRRRLRWLIDRPPARLYQVIFPIFHRRAMRRIFYQAFTPAAPRPEPPSLERVCAQLGIGA
jgi:radical SAM superfamily enzyme YgiQ (UPF0313 family)